MNDKSFNICNWCNQSAGLIWVHGHFQCSVCGINVDECCRGERTDYDFDPVTTSEEDSESEGH